MTIIVGYVPTAEGRAALDAAVEEARRRGTRLLVLNASRAILTQTPDMPRRSNWSRCATSSKPPVSK